MQVKIYFLSVFLLFSGNSLFSQEQALINTLKTINIADINTNHKKTKVTKEVHQHHLSLSKNNNNELEFLFSNLFLFYKSFISSQDFSSCMFSPSCSEYGIIAIKRIGFLEGVVATFDRLTRCQPLILPGEYGYDEETGLFIDEP
jgi:putative membrane protein insertion efficiency factor